MTKLSYSVTRVIYSVIFVMSLVSYSVIFFRRYINEKSDDKRSVYKARN